MNFVTGTCNARTRRLDVTLPTGIRLEQSGRDLRGSARDMGTEGGTSPALDLALDVRGGRAGPGAWAEIGPYALGKPVSSDIPYPTLELISYV